MKKGKDCKGSAKNIRRIFYVRPFFEEKKYNIPMPSSFSGRHDMEKINEILKERIKERSKRGATSVTSSLFQKVYSAFSAPML